MGDRRRKTSEASLPELGTTREFSERADAKEPRQAKPLSLGTALRRTKESAHEVSSAFQSARSNRAAAGKS